MAYRIQFKPAAEKQIAALDGSIRHRISPAIDRLADEPRPPGAVKLAGEECTWRVRVVDWRVLYEIHDGVLVVLVVLVVGVAHRREAYR